MCGIFSVYCHDASSHTRICDLLLMGLKTLEYRGYDSAGLYLLHPDGSDALCKSVGNVEKLRDTTEDVFSSSSVAPSFQLGLGHTRWATHGKPCDVNTHPHSSSPAREFVLVHNGIITNFMQLKIFLHDQGFVCATETDTEIIALLYLKFYRDHSTESFVQLTHRVISVLEGTFAVVVVSKQYPGEMIVARKDSPIILGRTTNGCYVISSDVNGIVSAGTNSAVFLKNNDVVWIGGPEYRIFNAGSVVERLFEPIDVQHHDVSKGSYQYFMEKEVYEQALTISMTFRERLILDKKQVLITELIPHIMRFHHCQRILMIACGSSYHACLAVRNHYEKIFHKKMIQIENACNMIDRRDFFVHDKDVVLLLSQSGETSDTLACLRLLKQRCSRVFACAITNMRHSTLARDSDVVVYNNIGAEIGVASTKSYTSQVLLLTMIALQFCDDSYYLHTAIEEIRQLPTLISSALSQNVTDDIVEACSTTRNILVLGRNEHYATAMEIALKLKEISYIHCEGLLADDLKHGPLAMIENSVMVIIIASNDHRMTSTIQQLRARNAKMMVLTDTGQEHGCGIHTIIPVKNCLTIPVLRAIVDIIPCQLLAYRVAVRKGINVDQPRHLAKSVTVSD